jgi:HPt (histidine-containing phosphotransfer) domain-containing protein
MTERLAALAAAFRKRLETDAQALRVSAAALDSGSAGERTQGLEAIRLVAHKLHGTAPAFDADDVAVAAGDLEAAAIAAAKHFAVNAALVHRELEALIALLDSIGGPQGAHRTFWPRM